MSLLNTGLSGLNAAQVGLQTAGHNIANASTPGFSRQQIVQTTNTSLGGSAGLIGQGVNVASVNRVYDDLLFAQGLQAQSQSSQLDGYYSQMQQIDGMFGDTNSGLSPVLQGFFNSVQGLANNPESVPSRQQLISSAQVLASRFQALDQRFSDMGGESNTRIMNSVTEINSLAQSISKLNFTIRQVQGTYIQPANDLMDQRDQLLTQLNQQIGTTTVKDSDGSLSVFIGNGQPLVTGSGAMTLTTIPSATNSARLAIGYVTGSRTSVIADSSLQGGKLGAYLAFRTNTLDGAQNALGRIATGLAQTFNDQHALGQDLNGAAGGAFFNSAAPRVIPNSGNTFLNSTVNASIGDVGKLTTSDYEFSYDGTNSTLKRLSDNVSVSAVGKPSITSPLNFDGIIITGGTVNVGDRFLIQPTHNGARDFSVAITDTAKIAAASPVRTGAASANTGSGVISAGAVNSPNNKVVISFTSPTAFNVVDSATGATLATNMAYTSGGDISFNGWEVTIADASSAPVAGNTFTIEHGLTSTNSTTATIGVTTLKSPPVDNFLGNTIKVVFDSATAFHLEGTTNNITGASTVADSAAGVAAAAALTNGVNTLGFTLTTAGSVVSNIGTSGAGSYTSNGTKLTVSGGTISGVTTSPAPKGTITVTGATVTVEGGSYPGSTTFKGVIVSINETTGAITIAAPSLGETASTFHGSPATGIIYNSSTANPISVNGWTAEITGSPAAGDSFTVSANTGGTADNRNALRLGGLQIENTLNGGTSSYQATYGQLVSQIGNKTRELEATSKAQSTMVTQILQDQQSMSGVNLDEEATSLMRYQQAYQASAKVLQLSNTLWQTLLDIR
jgi:flagellar hook-associated protein 1 FlgK